MSFNYGGVYGGGESGGGPHPDYDAAQSAVGRMSTEELRELLDEEQKCEQFVKTLHQVRSVEGICRCYLFNLHSDGINYTLILPVHYHELALTQ